MQTKHYPKFDVGAQANPQQYAGGFWTGNNLDMISELGIVKPSPGTDDLYSDTTNIYDIVDMEGYGGNATYDVYALINEGSTGALYARTITTGAFASVNAITENPTGALVGFNSKLYWGTTTKMGKYDGTTFTDAFQSWTVTQETGLYMPALVFAGKLFFGNMRYVASLDTSETFVGNALTLPVDVKIIDMRIWNDQIAILCQKTGSSIETKVFFWDGASATYNEVIGVTEAEPMAIFSYLGSLLLWGLNGRIYEYRGISPDGVSDFQIIADIPGTPVIKSPACVIMSDGQVLFGVLGASTNVIGVWAFGRLPATNEVALYQKYTPKGDYKFDDGVTDYYSVTSLFNLRVDDSVFNPSQSNEPATISVDSAAGDSTWNKITELTAPGYSMRAVACDTDGSVIVMGNSSRSFLSTDSGDSFEEIAPHADGGIAVDSDGSVIAIAAEGGYIQVSTDSGANFTQRASSQNWRNVSCDDDGSVMAATYGTVAASDVYVSVNSGTDWTSYTVGSQTNAVCMSSTGATMYASRNAAGVGGVMKSTDSGQTWANSGDASMNNVRGISCSSDGSKIVAASSGADTLWYSSDSGANWSQLTGYPTGIEIDTVRMSADGTKIILGTDTFANGESGIYYSDDTGANWSWLGTVAFTGTAYLGFEGIAMSRDGSAAYIVQDNQTGSNPLTFWKVSPVGTSIDLDDDVYAYTGSKETNLTSFYLKGLNPGFTVSSGNTITGIQVTVHMKKATGTTAKDVLVKLVKAGSIVGDNKGTDTDRSTTETIYTYGGTNDLWGTTWTDAQVNASDFGVVLQAKNTAAVLAVDYISIAVYWEPPATLPIQQEYVYAAVQRGNVTGVTETMKTGIVSLIEPGFSTANIITTGEDFELPANLKRIQSITIQPAKPLVGGEEIVCYATEDNTTAQSLADITWTEIASWGVGEDGIWKYPPDPLTIRRLRLKFELVPQSGTPTTPPTFVTYSINYEPLKLFHNL